MLRFRTIPVFIAVAFTASVLFFDLFAVPINAQTKLTYPELNTALKTTLPNRSFANKTELFNWLITQIKKRKVDKPLTADREDDLRQAGATDELIEVIRANSPALPAPTPTPPIPIVDLGDLMPRAINLPKPEYTEAARQAGVNGVVTLQLMLDEEGKVISTRIMSGLPHGLTENATAAAMQSQFTPASFDGKPARGRGTITYSFKIARPNLIAALTMADESRNKGDCDRAIAEYTKIIGADPKQSRAFFGRGVCYLMKANYDLAIRNLDSAVNLNQADGEAFFYLAVAHDFKGVPATATDYYGRAVSLKPEINKQSLTECLFIERRKMTQEEARAAANDIIDACDQSLRRSPGYLESLIYVKRGIGFRLKSDYDRAISDFEMAAKLNPEFTAVQRHLHTAYNSRGLLRLDKKDYKAAFGDISMAIKINPKSPTPYINRCVIHLYGWKDADRAIEDCTAAIRLSTKSSMAYNHRGYAYELKHDLKAAAADYQTALQMDPRNEAARTNLERIRSKVPSVKDQ